jgi:hypothetical protein
MYKVKLFWISDIQTVVRGGSPGGLRRSAGRFGRKTLQKLYQTLSE